MLGRQNTIVKIPEPRVRLKHTLGPWRLRRSLEGLEVMFHGEPITLPPGQYSAARWGGPRAYRFSSGKTEPKVDIHVCSVSQRPTRLLPHVDRWGIYWTQSPEMR